MELIRVEESNPEPQDRYYSQLEAGNALYLARTPVHLPEDDRSFLRTQFQSEAAYHKNIAYKPAQDVLTGAARGGNEERLRGLMRNFSAEAVRVVSSLLPRYAVGWRVDYASFRPFEEKGRKLRQHARNDLLHFDAFPTRPTNGDRILRFFVNLNPSEPRVWLTTEGFNQLAERFAGPAGLLRMGRQAASPLRRQIARLGRATNLPQFRRSPYDSVMHRFHNYLKENEGFQQSCEKQRWEFEPGSSWMVFTDSVSHAVISGQMALEQTFIVPRRQMLNPNQAPIKVLERLAGVQLA